MSGPITSQPKLSHPMEKLFKAPASDILDAIGLGFRTQVDVRGKIAELYLGKLLEEYKKQGTIDDFERNDKDKKWDFDVHKGKATYSLECKNLRSNDAGEIRSPGGRLKAYRVEVQKTRNAKEENGKLPCPSRIYPRGYFQVLAVCLFNQTGKWEYYFVKEENLTHDNNHKCIDIYQTVPLHPNGVWTTNISDIL